MFSSANLRKAYSCHMLAAWQGNYAPMQFAQFVRTVAFVSTIGA